MAVAKLEKELFVSCENRIGLLNDLAKRLAEADINISAISGYVVEEKAFFRILADIKAKEVLESSGYEVSLRDVVRVEVENKTGALEKIAQMAESAGIDLKYIYGSAGFDGIKTTLVFSSSNNDSLVELLGRL